MRQHLQPLLEEIQELEKLVLEKIHHATDELSYEIKDGKAVFELEVRRRHKALVKGIWRYFRDSSLLTVLTAPVIYAILIPTLLLDLFVSVYQRVCFPIYRIPRVQRSEFVVMDRHRLGYLNYIEKINCVYCGYVNGVFAFVREVASRTEQYWCPIKHARRVKGCHARQCMFCEYGDAEGFRREFVELSQQFTDLK
jgi:hypothetical protein